MEAKGSQSLLFSMTVSLICILDCSACDDKSICSILQSILWIDDGVRVWLVPWRRLEILTIEIWGIFKQKEQFDAKFC